MSPLERIIGYAPPSNKWSRGPAKAAVLQPVQQKWQVRAIQGPVYNPQVPAKVWRPPSWPATTGGTQAELVGLADNIGGYFFDAFIRQEHRTTRRITEHPVQDGANISDHSYQLPAQLTLEIGMSDAMDAVVNGVWASSAKSSVACES